MLELAEAAATKQDLDEGRLLASPSLPLDRTMAQINGGGARVTTQGGAEAVGSTKRTRTPREADASRSRKRRKVASDSSDAEAHGATGPSTQVSPAKRARKAAPPVPASTRVLRSRAPKSAAKIREEREMEEAYRRAVQE